MPARRLLLGSRKYVQRTVFLRDTSRRTTRIPLAVSIRHQHPTQPQLAAVANASFLRASEWPEILPNAEPVRTADLFSGCGIMTLGLWEACRAVGRRLDPVVAVDTDAIALSVYKRNFPDASVLDSPIESILDGDLGARSSSAERELIAAVGTIDLLIGGPPCQGHSNLNNHTRRDDPKNRLYERMARFAELFCPKHIIMENVSAVLHDKGRVVDRTASWLVRLGYMVDQYIADVATLGVPQRRRRHMLVASRATKPNVSRTLALHAQEPRVVGWAIGDLLRTKQNEPFDKAGVANKANQKRIDYLFRQNVYELPDRLRPDCHKLKEHSYKSVYGRMYWDQPAQTITSGFTCMGQGRYVHPKLSRTLTPHEAARLQFIPDFFRFGDEVPRTALSNLIGNAVPPKLTYVLALDLLR